MKFKHSKLLLTVLTVAGGLESTRHVNTASKEDSSFDVVNIIWTVGESKIRNILKEFPRINYRQVPSNFAIASKAFYGLG